MPFPFKFPLGRLKKLVYSVLENAEFRQLAKSVRGQLVSSFSLERLLKDHKVSMPLGVVVDENG